VAAVKRLPLLSINTAVVLSLGDCILQSFFTPLPTHPNTLIYHIKGCMFTDLLLCLNGNVPSKHYISVQYRPDICCNVGPISAPYIGLMSDVQLGYISVRYRLCKSGNRLIADLKPISLSSFNIQFPLIVFFFSCP
jgi:hypothetical protein